MHNQAGMGMRHSAYHINEKTDPRVQVEAALVTIFVNRLALNVLKNQIRFSGRSNACVNQFGDVRMRKLSQNSSFALESSGASLGGNGETQKLDGDVPFEPAVATRSEPDAAHPALSE